MPRNKEDNCAATPYSREKLVKLTDYEVRHLRDFFSALSAETRVRIILTLIVSTGELNVTDLAEKFGLSASAVSHHLRELRILGWVEKTKRGREVVYRIAHPCLENVVLCGIEAISRDN